MKIIVGEELPLIRQAIVQFCLAQHGCDVIAQFGTGQAALNGITEFQPDIAVLEFTFSDLNTLEILRRLRERRIRTRVIILSTNSERKGVLNALRAGAAGYILKSGPPEQLPEALRKVAHGSIYISPLVEIGKVFTERVQETQPEPKVRVKMKQDPLQTLSGREYQVFTMLVDGVRGKDIASRLKLSPKTVDTYRASLMRKLDIHDLPGLVQLAIQRENLAAASTNGAH